MLHRIWLALLALLAVCLAGPGCTVEDPFARPLAAAAGCPMQAAYRDRATKGTYFPELTIAGMTAPETVVASYELKEGDTTLLVGFAMSVVPGNRPTAGTYALEGQKSHARVVMRVVPPGAGPEMQKFLLATSGSAMVAQVDFQVGGRLRGGVTGASLVEVNGQAQPVPNGCATTMPSFEFDVPLEAGQ